MLTYYERCWSSRTLAAASPPATAAHPTPAAHTAPHSAVCWYVRASQGLELARNDGIDMALIDLKMPDIEGLEVLREIRKINAEIIPIIITGHGTIEAAVEAMKTGAFDFITKPFSPSHSAFFR